MNRLSKYFLFYENNFDKYFLHSVRIKTIPSNKRLLGVAFYFTIRDYSTVNWDNLYTLERYQGSGN